MKRLSIGFFVLLFSVVFWRFVFGQAAYHVHPVLDCPINVGQSVVYCGSFQLAWNQLMDLRVEPIDSPETRLDDQLNAREFDEFDVNPNCVSTFGGRNTVENRLRYTAKTAARFPSSEALLLPSGDHDDIEELIAVAYLEKSLVFPVAFERIEMGMDWVDSKGKSKRVEAFGIDDFVPVSPEHQKLMKQIEVIDYRSYENFVVRLKTTSESDELVLAKIPRPSTLKNAFLDVSQRVRDCKEPLTMDLHDELKIPKVYLDVKEDFFDKQFRKKFQVKEAVQLIRFSLDERGATLQSESRIQVLCIGESKHLHFNRPFLIYLKEKSSDVPYFAMWIDSDEFFKPNDTPSS